MYEEILTILSNRDNALINERLKAILKDLDIELPWSGNFSSFISDKRKKLVFE